MTPINSRRIFHLFQTSSVAGAGNGDQGEILKLQKIAKVSSKLVLKIKNNLCDNYESV